MFQVIIGLKTIGEYPTFAEAFKVFFDETMKTIKQGASWQFLETFFIVHTVNGLKCPLNFYNARDVAYDVGILVGDGKLSDPIPEVDPAIVDVLFLQAHTDQLIRELSMKLQKLTQDLKKTVGIC